MFLKPDDVREGPVQVTITDISEGKYDKPDIDFDDGTRLSLNATNSRVLARAFGYDSDDWIGKRIELALGEVEFKGQMQESIIVRPISPAPAERKAPPAPPKRRELDDDIGF
jgi:hypothetical protein